MPKLHSNQMVTRYLDLVKSSNFVLVRSEIHNRLSVLYCGEPKDEKKAFLQLEKLIKKNTKRLVTERRESNEPR